MKVNIRIDRHGNVIVIEKPKGVTLHIQKQTRYNEYDYTKYHHMTHITKKNYPSKKGFRII